MEDYSTKKKGAWTAAEDMVLRSCIEKYGEGNWKLVPQRAGLNRTRGSCRSRWSNYLSPSINRTNFTHEEFDLMERLHKLLGNRWSLIAKRLPGRTANDVKNYWIARAKKSRGKHNRKEYVETSNKQEEIIMCKPVPHRLFNSSFPSGLSFPLCHNESTVKMTTESGFEQCNSNKKGEFLQQEFPTTQLTVGPSLDNLDEFFDFDFIQFFNGITTI